LVLIQAGKDEKRKEQVLPFGDLQLDKGDEWAMANIRT
jgi:hypothetical protein